MLVIDIMDKLIDFELKICFYFPYKEVSGVPVLFFRLANELAVLNKLIHIYVIDYYDGAIARNLIINKNITLLQFKDGKTISPPEDAILVMQSILPYSIRPELKILPNTKLVFWNLHPDCLIPNLIPLPYLRNLQNSSFKFYCLMANTLYPKMIKNTREFVELAVAKKALWFMDQSNLDKTLKYLFTNFSDIDFVQVPVNESQFIKINALPRKGYLNFTWIGRLCDFKSYILIHTINKLSIIASEKKIKINYSIIGDGPFRKKIKNSVINNEWFTLEMIGSLKPEFINNYLLENTDVLTGMGTSALEGAKLGIPTILLDISYFPIKGDYKYRWLHESKNYDLAHDISQNDLEDGNLNLEQMLDDLMNNYHTLTLNSLNYFLKNHEMKTVLEKFLFKIKQSEMTFSDINPAIVNKSIARKTYDFFIGLKRNLTK
jgi:hypothetical protein